MILDAIDRATIFALAGRDLRRFFRQRSRVVGSIAQAVILWLVLGAGFGGSFRLASAPGTTYLEYFFPGVIVLTLLFTAIFATMSVIEDRHHGFVQAVLAAPPSSAALVLGKTLGGAAIALIQVAALLLLAPLAGVSLPAHASWAYLTAVLALAAVGFTALGFAVAWWVDSTQGYHAIMSLVLLPLWMLSGAMFPADGGNPILGAVMRANPMTYVVSAVRHGIEDAGVTAGAVAGGQGGLDAAACALFALISVTLAIVLCRRKA